jgi:hypothetical protein
MSDLGTTAPTIDEERPEVVAQAQRSRRGISLEVIGRPRPAFPALVLAALVAVGRLVDGRVLGDLQRQRPQPRPDRPTLAVSAPILMVDWERSSAGVPDWSTSARKASS